MKKYALFAAFLCLVSLFGCNKVIQTENGLENKAENETEYVYEPLTYKLVEPTHSELQKIRNKLGIISATNRKNYDCETDNAYQKLFLWNELEYYYVPAYDEEIAEFICEPVYVSEYGKELWDKTYYEKDPLGRFGDLSPKIFDENGVFDEKLYYKYCDETGNFETAGYNEYNGAFMDWLVEGVWNGKIDHDTFFEFDDTTKLYYHNGNYYSRKTVGGRGGGVFFHPVLYDVIELGDYKYEAHFVNMDDSDKPIYYTTMVIGMKEASNGFRFWSIYSIDEEIIKNTEREPLSYIKVYPTEQELEEMHEKLDIVFSTFFEDYDSGVDNAYEKLFEYNELNYFYVPEYEEEIINYVAKPYYTRSDGVSAWNVIINNRDPRLLFGEIPEEVLDKHGMLDMDLYSEYCDKIGDDFGFTLSGYYTYNADFVDWLVEGVWNGKVDHETVFEFSDKEMLYYCDYNGNYYTRRFEMGRGGGVFYGTKILKTSELYGHDAFKYRIRLDVLNDSGEHDRHLIAVVGMKEASNGFRFWSIYSLDYLDENDEKNYINGVPKQLYDEYGESIINAEEDDYSYIRINFDESREISGYAKLGVGYTFDDCTEYIDSNGAVYSELPEGGKYSYLRDWQDAEVPDIEGVDAVAASPYGGNLLMFAKDGKYGYLNTDGEIVIEAQFYEARPFSDGLAAVCREYGDPLEYINEKGETVLKIDDADGYSNIFRMADEEPSCDFSDGVALVYCGNEGFCIDKQGNRLNVKNPVGMHKQGRIAFYDEETKLYGFADKYGNIVIPAVYHGVFDFSQSGIALVKSTRNYNIPEEAQEFEVANYYRGYIDTEGNVVIPIEFEQPWWYYGTKGLIEPFESYGVVSLYKQGYIYYYRYDGTLLGKKPRMAYVSYENESYKVNVAEYWRWVNDGKPVG